MRNYIRILFLLLVGLNAYSQKSADRTKIEGLIEKAQKKYASAPDFQFSAVYQLFGSYKSSTVSESYKGVFAKNKKNSYAKIHTTEFVKLNTFNIKVDNESKLMQVTKDGNGNGDLFPYQLGELLSNFNDFKISSTDLEWICTLTAPKVTFVPYGKVILHINKKDYSLTKQTMYLLQQNQYTDSKGKKLIGYPRLEITFSKVLWNSDAYAPKFELSSYIYQSKNKYHVSKKYKSYQIVD